MNDREVYDLLLDLENYPIGLMFAQGERKPKQIRAQVGQRTEDEQLRSLEAPRVWQDFSGGGGYSRHLIDGTYEECEFGETSYPLIFTPAGYLQHVTMPLQIPEDDVLGNRSICFFFELSNGAGLTDLYMGAGQYIFKIPLGTGAPVVDADFGTGKVVYKAQVVNDRVFVSINGDRMWRKIAGGTWSQSAEVATAHMALVNWTIRTSGSVSNAWRLIGQDTATTFRHIDVDSDPMIAGNWSVQYQVGDTAHPIHSVASSNHHVWWVKQNGVHDVDERGYSPLLSSWLESIDARNGIASIVHPDGWLYASHHQGLARVWVGDPMVKQADPGWVHFGADLPYEGRIKGQCTALALNAGKLVAAFYNDQSGTSWICEGQDRRTVGLEGRGPIVWHGAKAVIEGKVTTLHVNSLQGLPRLHIGWTNRDGFGRYSYQWLPKQSSPYADWLDDSSTYYFQPTCRIFLPADPWGAPTGRKRIWAWELETENLVSGNTWAVHAAADNGEYSLQGAATSSPYTDLPVAASSVKGRAIRVRIDGTGAPSLDGAVPLASGPPILRALRATAEIDVKLGTYLEYRVVVGEGVQLRNDAPDRRDPEAVTEALMALQDRDEFQAVDRDHLYTLWMLPGLSWEDTQTVAGEWLRVITFRVRVLGRTIRYGTGERYGSGVVYAGTAGG